VSLKKSSKGQLPLFGKLHTVPAMKKVAVGLVTIRRAIAEVRKAEDYLLSGGVSKEELARTALAIAQYARQIDGEAEKLIILLGKMGTGAKAYEKELKNALG
jgi:hypothetical protein